MSYRPYRDTVRVVDPAAAPAPLPNIVIRRFTANRHIVTCVIRDPADAQQTLYGTVTSAEGRLVGSYYPADPSRQRSWRVVDADGTHYHVSSEPRAVAWLAATV